MRYSGKADVELIVQHHTFIGSPSGNNPWQIDAQSRTFVTSGFRVAGRLYPAQALAIGKEGDSVYNSSIAVSETAAFTTLQLNEDSGLFRIPLPASMAFSAPVIQPLLDSNFIGGGTTFAWQPSPDCTDSVFVEIRYDPPFVAGKVRGRPVERMFFIADNGSWTATTSLLKGIPAGGLLSLRFNRSRFFAYDSGKVRYEAAVYEATEGRFVRR